jgi:hypothetical protein
MSLKILLMILIGNKLANKAVKVCFYANFQAFVAFLKKNPVEIFKQKVRRPHRTNWKPTT